jgi:hypothetical protein
MQRHPELRIGFIDASDDSGYITQQAGASVLMIGTDYGRQDMCTACTVRSVWD